MCILNPTRVFTRLSTCMQLDAASCAAIVSCFPSRFIRNIAFAPFNLSLEGK